MEGASIDAIIAEHTIPATEPVAEAITKEVVTEAEPTEEATEEPTEPEASKPEEAFPKKAVNAISRRDRKIGELKARETYAQSRIAELEAKLATQQPQQKLASNGVPLTLPDGSPNPDAYTDYGLYLKDSAKHEFRQEMAEAEKAKAPKEETQPQENALDPQRQQWITERSTAIDVQSEEFVKSTPEAAEVFAENEEFITECAQANPKLLEIFLAADNAPLAFFNLAKEGKLERLITMPLAQAAMEIAKAQIATPKPQTKAPAPLPASRGSVASSKPLDDFQPDEIRKWMRSS